MLERLPCWASLNRYWNAPVTAPFRNFPPPATEARPPTTAHVRQCFEQVRVGSELQRTVSTQVRIEHPVEVPRHLATMLVRRPLVASNPRAVTMLLPLRKRPANSKSREAYVEHGQSEPNLLRS